MAGSPTAPRVKKVQPRTPAKATQETPVPIHTHAMPWPPRSTGAEPMAPGVAGPRRATAPTRTRMATTKTTRTDSASAPQISAVAGSAAGPKVRR